MKEGNWRLMRSKHWFGNAVAEALELDVLEASVKSKIKQLMEVWLENGQFEILEMVMQKRGGVFLREADMAKRRARAVLKKRESNELQQRNGRKKVTGK